MNHSEARKILGIDKDADSEAIKKAYRRLAMKHHPDKGGDEKEFKKINEANEVLQRPEQTARPQAGQWHGGHPDLDEILSGFRGFGSGRQVKNAIIDISLEDAFKGTSHKIQWNITVNGEHKTEERDIIIPAGVQNGEIVDSLELPNITCRTYVRISSNEWNVDWGQGFGNERGNCIRELNLPVIDMMLGGWHDVNLIDGAVGRVYVTPAARAGMLLKVKEKGYWKDSRRQQRGDCFFRLIPIIKSINDLTDEEAKRFTDALEARSKSKTGVN